MYSPVHLRRRTPRIALALLLGITLLASGLGPTRATAASQTVSFATQYEAAVIFDAPPVSGFVFVTRLAQDHSGETFLQVLTFSPLTGYYTEDGYGLVPNSALTVTGNVARLLVDTSNLPGYTHFAGSGGPLDITWTKDGALRVRTSGTTNSYLRNHLIQVTSGTRVIETATAQGTISGYTLEGVLESVLSTSQGAYVYVQH